jgi:hypothetical protein
MLGEPTGLEPPESEVPGMGKLLVAMGDTEGGVTEDMTIVGGWTLASSVRYLTSFVLVAVVDVPVPLDSKLPALSWWHL